MPCIDPKTLPAQRPVDSGRWARPSGRAGLLTVLALLVGGCGGPPAQRPAPPAQPSQAPQAEPGAARPAQGGQPLTRPQPQLPWPAFDRARDWTDYRVMAARRIVAANPAGSHLGEVQQPLLAIPVLEIELHADGSLRRVGVLRQPTQARDTVQLAIDAVKRAAPFAPVGHLPHPWKFTEVFLFNDQRQFKPRSLED